jgi:hypothetical protein
MDHEADLRQQSVLYGVRTATLVEPRIAPNVIPEAHERAIVRGSNDTDPKPLTKTPNVGVAPGPICVVTLATIAAMCCPVLGFVWHNVISTGSPTPLCPRTP